MDNPSTPLDNIALLESLCASPEDPSLLLPNEPPFSDAFPPPDPATASAYLLLSPDDPFLEPAIPDPPAKPEPSLLPFDMPIPSQPTLHPVVSTTAVSTRPTPVVAQLPSPDSPLQENRACSQNVAQGSVTAQNRKAGLKQRAVGKRPPCLSSKGVVGVKKEVVEDPVARQKDKLAQRKLRNKESARRYREKQVARRKQLELYTRSLTAQNRELESLHDRLLKLTCQRRMGGMEGGGGVGGGLGGGLV